MTPSTAQTPSRTDPFTFTSPYGLSSAGGLVQASDGNLYGTAISGGENGYGAIFQVTSSGVLRTLYSFIGSDGASPFGNLIQARDGNLYGTTSGGGANNDGTIFKMTTGGALTTLYSFGAVDVSGNYADGAVPDAGLMQATDGNLYGTTFQGGAGGSGTIYKITPSGTFTSLHTFLPYVRTVHGTGRNRWWTVHQVDGANPYGGVVQARDGNIYGTTEAGDLPESRVSGGLNGSGSVYRVTLAGAFTKLNSFGAGSTGANPAANLVQASDGKLYGTTSTGSVLVAMLSCYR